MSRDEEQLDKPLSRRTWEWVFQWRDLCNVHRWNWCNFEFITLAAEAGRYKGRYLEIRFVVFGLGFELTIRL